MLIHDFIYIHIWPDLHALFINLFILQPVTHEITAIVNPDFIESEHVSHAVQAQIQFRK